MLSGLNMIEKTDSRILFGLGIKFVLVYIILLMFDVLLDGLMALFDFMIELMHILIEIVEIVAEEGLEKFLHTGHQQSEMIILNSALIVSGILVYYFIKALPHLIIVLEQQLLKKLKGYWAGQLMEWQLHSIWLKLNLILVYIVGFSGLIMLIG